MLPNVLGLSAFVVGGDVWLRLSNYSGKEVVILGYQGEPYLRFEDEAVLPERPLAGRVPQPVPRPARDRPRTREREGPARVGAGRRGSDVQVARPPHLLGARASRRPGVKEHPELIQRIFGWRVPGRADGKPFAITGILGYRARAELGGRRSRLGAGRRSSGWAALVALVSIGLWVAHRRSRRATQP